jgi:GNAT superfamily N-acetyltransferase
MILAGLTHDELLHEALVQPRSARADFPDTRVTERPGWFQILTPSFRTGGLNEVAGAQLSDDEADAVIARTLAEYAAHDVRFRWIVTPDSRPKDLGERLSRHGMSVEQVQVMAAAVADLAVEPPPDIEVVEVGSAELDTYVDTVAAGWNTDPEPLRAYLRFVSARRGPHHSFLALDGGRPVGAADHVAFTRSALFMGAVVLPEHRGRGVYRALLAARLRHVAAAGIRVVTTHARATTSAPILAHLGFATLVELDYYFNR